MELLKERAIASDACILSGRYLDPSGGEVLD